MKTSKEVFVQNCLLFILEKNHGENPKTLEKGPITATPSFIAVGTIPDADGPTTITLTDEKDWPNSNPDMSEKFTGEIETPGRTIQVCTVLWREIFNVPVKDTHTKLQILTNDEYVPDKICIIISG